MVILYFIFITINFIYYPYYIQPYLYYKSQSLSVFPSRSNEACKFILFCQLYRLLNGECQYTYTHIYSVRFSIFTHTQCACVNIENRTKLSEVTRYANSSTHSVVIYKIRKLQNRSRHVIFFKEISCPNQNGVLCARWQMILLPVTLRIWSTHIKNCLAPRCASH